MPWMDQTIKKSFKDVLTWQMDNSPKFDKKNTPHEPLIEEKGMERWTGLGGEVKVMWLGHATFLVEVHERTILIDPVFGDVNTLVRRQTKFPFDPRELPPIDAVLLTHGHYDHLNIRSLAHLAKRGRDTIFMVPLGQKRYLPPSCRARTLEFDWWDHVVFDDIQFTFLPSQHWHQRGPFDYNKAIWGGWWVEAACGTSFYHMGDSGHFGGFEAIAETMGEPDVMALPAGAYEPRWFMKLQHMDPDEAWRVWETLGATHAIPMHYGTFDLSDEPLSHGLLALEQLCSNDERRAHGFLPLPHGGSTSFTRGERMDDA